MSVTPSNSENGYVNQAIMSGKNEKKNITQYQQAGNDSTINNRNYVDSSEPTVPAHTESSSEIYEDDTYLAFPESIGSSTTITTTTSTTTTSSYSAVNKPLRKSSRSRSASLLKNSRLLHEAESPSPSMKLVNSLNSLNGSNASCGRRSSVDSNASSSSLCSTSSVKYVAASINKLMQHNISSDHINTEINFNISKPILNNIITSQTNLVDLNSERGNFAHEQSPMRSEIASTQSTLTSKNIKSMENGTPSPNNATTPVANDSTSSLKSAQISQTQQQTQPPPPPPPPLLQHSSSVGSTSHIMKQPHAPTRFNSSLSSSSLERSKPGTTMDRGRASGSSGTTTPGLVFPSSPTPSLRTSSTGSMNQMIKPMYLQQQYVINEKQYLKKIKNTKSSQNDYYTRGIFANTNSSLDVDSFYKDGNLKLNTYLASPDSEGNPNSSLLDSAISPTTMINENPYFDHFTTKLDSSNQDMLNYNSSKLSGNSNDWASNRVSAMLQNNDGSQFESLEKITEDQTNDDLVQNNEFGFSTKMKQAQKTRDSLSLESVERIQTPVDTLKNQFLNKLKSKNVSQLEADYLRELQRYDVYDKNDIYIDEDLADPKSFERFTKQSFDKKNLQSDNGLIDPSSPTTNFPNLPLHISPNFVTLDDCNIEERLEWQLMLTRVLKGDIVQNEKSKLSELKEQIRGHTKNFKNNIWMELKAWMNGNSVQDQMKSLQVLKNTVADDLIQKILEYQFITDESGNIAVQECDDLIEQYYKVTTYWKNLKDMYVDKPITATPEFQNVLDLLTSFGNIRNGMRPLLEEVIESTNVYQYCSALNDVMSPGIYGTDALNYQINSSYVDKFNKEEDIESTFQKRIFSRHAPWIFKATSFAIKHKELFEKMNLQSHTQCVRILLLFPLKLIMELIKIKLDYSKNLVDPTMMIIDQIIEDLCVQIKLAAQIKYSVMGSAFFVSDWSCINEFEHVVVGAIQHVFEMINLKIASKSTSIFKTSKDTDELLQHWETFRNMGVFVNEKIGYEVAHNYTKLFLQLTMKLHVFILKRIKKIPEFKKEQDLEKWLIESLEKIGTVKRKFGRFFHNLSGSLINQSNFEIDDFDAAMNSLKESDHVFIYTGGNLESYGVYVVASKELIQNGNFNKQKLLQILNNEAVCSSLTPSMDIKNSLNIYSIDESNHQSEVSIEENLYWKTDPDNKSRYHYVSKNSETPSRKTFAPEIFKDDTLELRDLTNKLSLDSPDYNDDEIAEDELLDTSTGKVETKTKNAGYLLLLKPKSTILWEGTVATLNEPLFMHELKLDIDKLALSISHMCLFTEGSSYNTDSQIEKILGMMGNSVRFLNKVCSLNSINKVLNKINMVYYKMTTSLLICYPEVVLKTDEKFPGCEILNNGFLFCRDFARSYLASSEQWLSEDRKSALILNIMQLSIQWVGFICDKCNPTDLKTFRWCVPAMEYAMKLTSGRNVLTLSDDQYNDLKRKISGCMSLLISHFDIMGGRARAMAENKYLLAAQQKLSGTQILLDEYDDDAVLQVNSQIRMESIKNLEKHYRKKSKQKRKVGKVLNDSDREDKYLATLASSLSNVSIKWRKRQYIGGGSFGDVYSAINLDTGSILAVKQIKIQHSKNMEKIYPRIKDEMNVLEVLNHPNVVQYYGVEVHREKVNIFMEFCEGGSLAALLEHGRFEDEVITQIYSLQLLEGLAYLHHSGVVHRDIKPENILLDHNGVVKYVDFGAAELISKNGTRKYSSTRSRNGKQNSMMGTPMYMAPENITGKRKGNQLGSDDIWSLGCVVLEMATGRRPWAHLDNEWAIMYHVAAGQIPQFPTSEEMSSSGVRFLSRLLKNNPDQRATAVELLLDPWIVEIRKIAFSADDSSSSSSTPASTPL